MQKTILITGSTDGIGLATAKQIASLGHHVLLHGRNPAKLEEAEREVAQVSGAGQVECYQADLSDLEEVEALAKALAEKHQHLDVVINNAGVFRVPNPVTKDGLDARFVVNTLAPYLLTQRLLPLMDSKGRVVNLSSAAQSPVNTDALAGRVQIGEDFAAYAQSKLALTIWSRAMAFSLEDNSPSIVAVNPGSMLGSKMVQEGFGVAGGDIGIGADILTRASLSEEFAEANGQYFDNDAHQFASPHSDALNPEKVKDVMRAIESVLSELTAKAGN
ncbi:MAG: SDR family NAD(P)-dependent oxidoreductase [Gammaproteobacteria bacterium]|nr:MAG: SDR family NAD(P)-dependent oxidoreductase [Gammaproteobacteria bacterium]